MSPEPPNPPALAILKFRLERGLRASPLCLAVIGWLCGVRTEPYIADLRLSDGQALLRLSDEMAPEPLCPFLDFLDQVRIICVSLQMTDSQTREVVAWARHRLGE